MFRHLVIVLLLLGSTGCIRKPSGASDTSMPADTTRGIYICCEGNFQWSNATLGWLQTSNNSYSSDIFRKANQRGLGDVLQSACLHNHLLYLVVNNSGKIEVADPITIQSKGTIAGLTSPRYLLPLNDTLGYVSDLYGNGVSIVNLRTLTVTGKISIRGWTEEMLHANDKVWVCGRGSSHVYVIDPLLHAVADSIYMGFAPQHLVKDRNGKIWVLTNGGSGKQAQLHRVNAVSRDVEKTFNLGVESAATRLITDEGKCHLYWIQNGIQRMSVDADILPSASLVVQGSNNFYSLGFDPFRHWLMAADAKDYVQPSEVMQYDTLGNPVGSFKAGINTSFFCIKP